MATSISDVIKESVTLKKDIQIRDFANRNAVSNAAIFFYNDTEPFCKVSVNPVCRSNPEFVSVRVKRCSFYPRFYHGVVYKSLGWMVSVVDAEGAEKFVSYFRCEDFQSLNWVEDFFSERGYEMQEFVKRSVLLDDPEGLLPEGVLTVRVEMFYECQVGGYETVILETFKEIRVYNSADFYPKKQIDVQLGSSSRGQEPVEISKDKNAEDAMKSVEVLMEYEYVSLEEKKKEIILMMEETFQEVKEAIELRVNYQRLEHIAARNNYMSLDIYQEYYRRDLIKEMDLFQRLFAEVGFEPPIVWDIGSRMVKPLWFYEKYKQLLRIWAINKHLKVHWINCKEVYKTAAQKRLVQISEDDGRNTHYKSMVEEGIRELFFIYKETVKESQPEAPDHLFMCVSRFLKVSSDVIRVLSDRLFLPIIMIYIISRSPIIVYREDVNEVDKLENTSPCNSTSMQSKGSSIGVASSMDTTDLETSGDNEPWYFTIETSDNEQIKIPFQTGTTTLGSFLRSASPVFDRMLETQMAEQSNRFLKINDFDYFTFSHFLVFLQDGTVHAQTVDDCMKLYQFAHKYQAEELCLRCVKKIEAIIAFDFSEVEKIQEFSKFYQEDRLQYAVHFGLHNILSKMPLWVLKAGSSLKNYRLSSEPTRAKHFMKSDIVGDLNADLAAFGLNADIVGVLIENFFALPTDGKYDFYQ